MGVRFNTALILSFLLTSCSMYDEPAKGVYDVQIEIGNDSAPAGHCKGHASRFNDPTRIRGCAEIKADTCRVTLSQTDWWMWIAHEIAHCLDINHHQPPRGDK